MARRSMGTEYVSSQRLAQEQERKCQDLCRRVDEQLGPVAFLGDKIRAGTHTLDEALSYQAKLKDVFSSGFPNPPYSQLAYTAASFLISDLEASLAIGSTYNYAVHNLNAMPGVSEEAQFKHEKLVSYLRPGLYGKDTEQGRNADFPGLLTALWMLKGFRPNTYENSLNAAKWAVLIGEAVNACNRSHEFNFELNTGELFLYSLVQNIGMLDPEMPLVDSDRVLSAAECMKLAEHGKRGIVMLEKLGFPITDNLVKVLTYHNAPKSYSGCKDYDEPKAIMIGINATAEAFEGMYFKRDHRSKVLTPKQVFQNIEAKLFTPEELSVIKKITRMTYSYDIDQAKKYPLLLPYQMLRLLFAVLDKD